MSAIGWKRALRGVSVVALAAGALGGWAACKKSVAEVDASGVRTACEKRNTWKKSVRRDCTTCFAKATTPRCSNCGAKEYSGKCAELEKAKRDEPTCEGTHECVHACKRDDCGCIEKCYEGKATCQKLAAALDTCWTEACTPTCNGEAE